MKDTIGVSKCQRETCHWPAIAVNLSEPYSRRVSHYFCIFFVVLFSAWPNQIATAPAAWAAPYANTAPPAPPAMAGMVGTP
jgi:hypothetical protein